MPQKRLALGYLVFVMDRYMVHAACMDVKMLAKILKAHGGALYMPPRIPHTPRTFPLHYVLLRSLLPQRKISRIMLFAVDFHPGSGLLILQPEVGQLTVIPKLFNIEIYSVACLIAVALFHQSAHKINHAVYVLRGARRNIGAHYIERINILEKYIGIICRYLIG